MAVLPANQSDLHRFSVRRACHQPIHAIALLDNVYGWFPRVKRGTYTLSDTGRAALIHWRAHVPAGG